MNVSLIIWEDFVQYLMRILIEILRYEGEISFPLDFFNSIFVILAQVRKINCRKLL